MNDKIELFDPETQLKLNLGTRSVKNSAHGKVP